MRTVITEPKSKAIDSNGQVFLTIYRGNLLTMHQSGI
uniref:Uncharacterized protein n=1 Tax=Arundo donax TaxID=35708 RepID=A0A0A8YCM6_ARUDO